jgi:hypothetical protein
MCPLRPGEGINAAMTTRRDMVVSFGGASNAGVSSGRGTGAAAAGKS